MCLTKKSIVPGLVALGICFAAGNAAQPDKKPAEPIPFADGVLDAELRTAFVSSPKGGVQAIRLDDGKVLWTNDTCLAQPWLVAGRRLIARAERLFVVDTNDGKILKQCDAPAYPKVVVPERCTVSFQLWGPRVQEGGDTLEARWFGVAYIDRSKGRPFPFEAWTAFNKSAPAGTLKIDLASGRVDLKADAKATDVSAGLIPEAAKPGQQIPVRLPPELAAVWQRYHKEQNGCIAMLGERMVGVSMTLEPVGKDYLKRVTLNAWDLKTGKAAAPVELIKDKALNIANVVLTEDRRHAAVGFGNSTLTIYALADGKLVGSEVKGVQAPEHAFVAGKRLYYSQQTPSVLKALDLETRMVAWQRDLKPRSTIVLPP